MCCVSFARTASKVDSNLDRIIVDRIEGKYAVCETESGKMIEIKVSKFKTKPEDGEIFRKNSNGKYVKDNVATKKSSSKILKRFLTLFK
jgi:hypothetical protein